MAYIHSQTERTITLGYQTMFHAQEHLGGIAKVMFNNYMLLAALAPFQFQGKKRKRYESGSYDFDDLGIRIRKCDKYDFRALENGLKVMIDDEVPPFVKADFLYTGKPQLHMLKGIPLDVLSASKGSKVAHAAFSQLHDLVETIAVSGIITSDLKPANAIWTEIAPEDCEMWAEGYGLEPGQQRVFLIDGGQFVSNKDTFGGVVSLFRELNKSDEDKATFLSDPVAEAFWAQAKQTLDGSSPDATAMLNPLLLVECALFVTAIKLGVAYSCNPALLHADEKPRKFWIGGEGL